MDFDELFDRKNSHHRRERREHDHTHGGWRHHEDDDGERPYPRRGHTDLARVVGALRARPRLLAAAAGVLLVVVVAGIGLTLMLLDHIGEHGVKGIVEDVFTLGKRLWEGS